MKLDNEQAWQRARAVTTAVKECMEKALATLDDTKDPAIVAIVGQVAERMLLSFKDTEMFRVIESTVAKAKKGGTN